MTAYGIHDHRSYADALALFPNTVHVREFVPGVRNPSATNLVTKIMNLAQPALDKGLTSWISFKLAPADVANGLWDAQLENVGTQVPPDVLLIPHHEPEDDLTADEFTKMFNRVARRIKAAGRGHQLVYSAMAYQWINQPSTNIGPPWFPAEADINAIDVYSGQSFPLTAILPEHKGFARWNDKRILAGAGDRPWAVTERGFITGTEHQLRAKTIAREAEWLKTSGCQDYIYWNTSGTEGNPDIILDATYGEPAVQAMMDATEDPYDAGYQAGLVDGHAGGFAEGYEQARIHAIQAIEEM